MILSAMVFQSQVRILCRPINLFLHVLVTYYVFIGIHLFQFLRPVCVFTSIDDHWRLLDFQTLKRSQVVYLVSSQALYISEDFMNNCMNNEFVYLFHSWCSVSYLLMSANYIAYSSFRCLNKISCIKLH